MTTFQSSAKNIRKQINSKKNLRHRRNKREKNNFKEDGTVYDKLQNVAHHLRSRFGPKDPAN